MPGQLDVIDGQQGVAQPVAQAAYARHDGVALGCGQLEGDSHAHRPGHVLRAGATVALL